MAISSPEPAFWHCPRCRTPNPRAGYVEYCLGCGAPRSLESGSPTTRVQTRRRGRFRFGLRLLRDRAAGLFQRAAASFPRLALAWPRRRGLLFWLSLGYAATLLILLILARTLGDAWFPATLLLYSPRALWLIPLPLLAIWALLARRRSLLLIHLATLLCLAWPWVGLQIPLGRLVGGEPDSLSHVRMLSFNALYGEALDVGGFLSILDRERIDVVCLQEWDRASVERHPDLARYFENWHWDDHGHIVSRLPIVSDHLSDRGSESLPDRSLGMIGWITVEDRFGNPFDVVDLYFESIRGWFSELVIVNFVGMHAFEERRRQDVAKVVALLAAVERPVLIAGDFNMPADSPLFRPFRGRYQDAFEAAGWGIGATFPSGMPWMRLDHILADGAWRVRRCLVVGPLGSDHRPIQAELDLMRLRATGR